MPKKIKEQSSEIPEEQQSPNTEEQANQKEEVFSEENIKEKRPEEIMPEPPVYIPEIPEQIIKNSEPKRQTETEFLLMILQIQEDGGFGRHLNKIINDRIKLIS